MSRDNDSFFWQKVNVILSQISVVWCKPQTNQQTILWGCIEWLWRETDIIILSLRDYLSTLITLISCEMEQLAMEEKSATRDIYWHFPCSLSPHKKVLMESLQFPGVSLSFSGCCHAILPTCRKSAESMLSHVSPFSADMAEFAFMDDSGVYSSILFQKHNGIKRV